jgi:hypothetical protein
MSDARLLLQKAIYSRLTGNAALMAKLTGVFDFIPDNQTYPFIQIGEVDYSPFDTQTFDGFQGTITINLWHRSSSRGRSTLHDIQNDVYNLLHNWIPSVSGYTVVSMRFDFSNIIVDPDAVTYHGVQRFKIIMGGN